MLGLSYMAAAGAPWAYLGINAAALLIGLLMIGILKMVGAGRVGDARYWPGVLTIVLAAALLATALLGARADGAARWVRLGGLSIQPSLILLPVMIMAFAASVTRSPRSEWSLRPPPWRCSRTARWPGCWRPP
jgi:cell division protein FtsW (lipid II flippase)